MNMLPEIPPGAKVLVVFNGFGGHLGANADYRESLTALLERKDIEVCLLASGEWVAGVMAQKLGRNIPWRMVAHPKAENGRSSILIRSTAGCDGLIFQNEKTARLSGAEARRLLESYEPLLQSLQVA